MREGMSLAALAELVHYSKGYLSRVERGQRLPTPDIAARCDEALGADGELTELAKAASRRSSPAAARPAQLPPGVPGFRGRAAELRQMEAASLIEPALAPPIMMITGPPGVGKTALAVRFAHEVAAQYPDGQLHTDLRGFGPSRRPVDPGAAIRGFLDALGVPTARIPAELAGLAALYRSVLAGKRLLLVLDNARDARQVRPLLPGAPGCLVLITSRSQLAGLIATEGALPIELDLLTIGESRELLAARIGQDRVAAEPRAAAEIVRLCGRLPLALAIVAARASIRPAFSLGNLATELHDDQLDALAAGDDPTTDARSVFSWSYHELSPASARLLRLMGLHPGPQFSATAAASVAGLPVPEARTMLAELTRAHLISETARGRYSFHDLLRVYAAQQAVRTDSESDRHTATQRMLDFYLQTATVGDCLLDPSQEQIAVTAPLDGVSAEPLADPGEAHDWFTTERTAVLAAIDHAATAGLDTHVWQLASAVWTFLDRQGAWQDQATTQRAALAAAKRLNDPDAQAHAHQNLSRSSLQLGRTDDALLHLNRALTLRRQVGDEVGQATIHHNLAIGYGQQGLHDEALSHSQRALGLYRRAGNRRGQARSLNNIGWYQAQLGHYQEALTACEQSLALHQDIDDRQGQAGASDSLGYVRLNLGQPAEAISGYQHALAIYRELGDRSYEADTLTHLGDAHVASGNIQAAIDAWEQAEIILTDLDPAAAAQVRARRTALEPAAHGPVHRRV